MRYLLLLFCILASFSMPVLYSSSVDQEGVVEEAMPKDFTADLSERGTCQRKASFRPAYPFAYHRVSKIVLEKDLEDIERKVFIGLSDDSLWDTRPEDALVALEWQVEDCVSFSANALWWPDVDYVCSLYNYRTGETIQVNLKKTNGASIENPCIDAIEHYLPKEQRVVLKNGSYWMVMRPGNSRRFHFALGWEAGDQIVIGINYAYLIGPVMPNLLINLTKRNYAFAGWEP